jgi:hypothetical protein
MTGRNLEMHRPASFMLLLLIWPWVAALGAMSQTNALFQSMLRDNEEGRQVESRQTLGQGVNEEMESASPEDIRQFLPVILKCLESKSRSLHTNAIIFLAAVALRPDGADRLEPFLERLAAVLGDGADQDLKRGVISVVAASVPKPSSRELAFLAAHLNDTDITGQQLLGIGVALVDAYPNDPVVLHTVIERFRKRSLDSFEAGRMMEALGLLRITADEALRFLGEGLDNPLTRQSAIESLGRMPPEARARFLPRLQQIAEDPNELADTRSRARHVLEEQ